MTDFQIKRICAGEYKVTKRGDKRNYVRVCKVVYPDDGTYWIAAPNWTMNTTDPVHLKSTAVYNAKCWLAETN